MEAHEARRKVVHMAGALGPPASIVLFGWAASVAILAFLIAHVVIGAVLERRGVRLPIIGGLLVTTRRPHERNPVAALEFLVAILMVGVLAHEDLFFPVIAVLALGDGTAALVGLARGRHPLPGHARKTWEGLGAGIVAGVVAALAFGPLGAWVHREAFESSPLVPTDPFLTVPAFLAVGYLIVWGALEALARMGRAARFASADRTVIVAALTASLATGLLALTAARTFDGPVLPADLFGGATNAAVYLGVSAAIAMTAEGWIRRHDNLLVPGLTLGLTLVLAATDPLGLGR